MKHGKPLPKISGQGSCALNGPARDRLDEAEPERVEHRALQASFQRADFATSRIVRISKNWMPDRCQMFADLMRSPGVNNDSQMAGLTIGIQYPYLCQRRLIINIFCD